MYLPSVFQQQSQAVSLRIMRENPLANLITQGSEPSVNPVPTVVDEAAGNLSIRFHLALKNPQCDALGPSAPCLAVFTGPNCYVSPSWYTEHPNVPTWNYVSAHAYGTVSVLDTPGLEQLLTDLTNLHEHAVGGDWRFQDLPAAFKAELLGEIRGFRLTVQRIETKAKLSQNRIPVDRERVLRRLLESSEPGARAVGRWMQEILDPSA